MALHNKTGHIGESVVSAHLQKQGFIIREQNYTRKWGEIDVVAKKGNVLHFCEVKATADTTLEVRPEEHIDKRKVERLRRAIQTYMHDRNISEEQEWQFDVFVVYLDHERKKARIKSMYNVVI